MHLMEKIADLLGNISIYQYLEVVLHMHTIHSVSTY